MLDPNSCVCTHPRQYGRQEWINSIKRASSPRVPIQGTGNCQGISALTHCHSWASQQPASDTVTALATSAHWVLSLLEIKIILTPLCSCADSGVQKHSHMYWNLCCGYEDLGVYLHATNLTNFIPFEVWWLLQSRHVEQSVRKSCGRQMSAFPSVPYGPCRVPAGMITWSMAWVSPGAPLPALAGRAHWLFTLLLHHKAFLTLLSVSLISFKYSNMSHSPKTPGYIFVRFAETAEFVYTAEPMCEDEELNYSLHVSDLDD